jgi:NAD(P)-dependent dehydrogenase (short-subunit alcohol dehydrogenase family)
MMTENPSREGELEGKVALITGASFGIGRATAIRLAQEGARVAVLARSANRLDETIRLIDEQVGSGNAFPIPCDVTIEQAVIDAFARTIRKFGDLDIVVNNAGSMQNALIENASLKLWQDMYDVLATAYFLVAREAFRFWKANKRRGSLVFVTSKNAVAPSPGASAYASAKAASQHLARCLAEEGGPAGIRVNMVMPDAVIRGTNILPAEQRAKSAARHGIPPNQLEEYFRQRCALKVMITPEDIAETILFLAGPRSAHITGAAITVDGGMSVAYLR